MNSPLTPRSWRRPLAITAAFLVALAASLSIAPTAQAVPHAELTLALDHTTLSTGDLVGGTVTALDGQPLEAGEFEAALVADDDSQTFATAPVGSDGRFVMHALTDAGTHDLEIRFAGASRSLVSAPIVFDDTPWTPEITVEVEDIRVGQEAVAQLHVDLKGHPTAGFLEVYIGGSTYSLPLDGPLTVRSPRLDLAASYALSATLVGRGARQTAVKHSGFFVSKWYSETTLNTPGHAFVRDVINLSPVNDRGRTDFSYELTTPEVCTLEGPVLTMTAAGDCHVFVNLPETDTDYARRHGFIIATYRIPTVVTVSATPGSPMPGSEVVVEATASSGDGAEVPSGTFTLTAGPSADEIDLPAVDGRATFRVPAGKPGLAGYRVTFTPDDAALATSSGVAFVTVDDPSRYAPQITSKVTSSLPRTASGWYRSPVTVRFTCTSEEVALTTACPAPITLRHGRHAAITRTVTTTAGRSATVTVPAINVDLKAPNVRLEKISTITRTAHLDAPKKPACISSDATSGVATCTVKTVTKGNTVTWTATATDRAGNRSTRTASTTLVKARIKDAKIVSGTTQAKAGKTHVLEVRASNRPTLKGHAFTKVNKNTWRTNVKFTAAQAGKTLTLKPKAGKTTFTVKVKVVR